VHHEEISLLLMEKMNRELDGRLDLAICIYKDEYEKRFLHQLVSSQLDMDRLDYLRRDSFYTGVTEGNIGSARIIKMLGVKDDHLVVESKGIYSIENFLTARRLMYWQVYLHKTSVVCEKMLIHTLTRAKELARKGEELYVSPALRYFLYNDITREEFFADDECLANFLQLDDNDIWCALKAWASHPDKVLAILSAGLVNRQLFKVEVSDKPFSREYKNEVTNRICAALGVNKREVAYLHSAVIIEKDMYSPFDDHIEILYNDGTTRDIAEASDMFNLSLLKKKVKKYFFCYHRDGMKDEEASPVPSQGGVTEEHKTKIE
jgi:HD superfamily phosphohydrolase